MRLFTQPVGHQIIQIDGWKMSRYRISHVASSWKHITDHSNLADLELTYVEIW